MVLCHRGLGKYWKIDRPFDLLSVVPWTPVLLYLIGCICGLCLRTIGITNAQMSYTDVPFGRQHKFSYWLHVERSAYYDVVHSSSHWCLVKFSTKRTFVTWETVLIPRFWYLGHQWVAFSLVELIWRCIPALLTSYDYRTTKVTWILHQMKFCMLVHVRCFQNSVIKMWISF